MKPFLLSCLLAVLAAAGLAGPAAAEFSNEWSSERFTPQRSAPLPKATPAARSAPRAATTSRSTSQPARVARSQPVEEVSRPQRRNAPTRTARPSPSVTGGSLSGIASYYWQPQPVASGGRFNPEALTAAHKSLPFGTRVRVTRQDNGRSVDVTINDRGPYIAGRIIDLSRRAARDIGMIDQGVTRVNVSIIGR